ncbi:MAG: sensor histidine kinase [Pirellulales bacterium]
MNVVCSTSGHTTAGAVVVACAALISSAAWGEVVPEEAPLADIAEILDSLESPPKNEPWRIAGVVTFRHDQSDRDRIVLVVQEDDAAVWVIAPYRECEARTAGFREFSSDVRPGERVIVSGQVDPDSYGPRILATSIVPDGRAPLPAPLSADRSGVFIGAGGAVRTVVEGIVQSVRRDKGFWTLALDVDGRRVTVRSAHPPGPGIAEQLVDAKVRATGVAGSVRNSRGQFLGPVVVINGFDDVDRIAAPPSPAFDAPFVPLAEIAQFGSPSLGGHRFQTEGVVTRSLPTRYLFLQDGGVGIRVETGDKEVYRPGDRVRVAGFIDTGRQLRGMTGAVTRRIGHDPAPDPIQASPQIIAGGTARVGSGTAPRPRQDFAGQLVTFSATVVDAGPTRDGGVLRLASNDTILEAVLLPAAYESSVPFVPGSEISVKGIVQYDVARSHEELLDGRLNPFERFTLIVHDANDVTLIRAPPWWTPMRLTTALVGLLVVLAAALAWAWSLRRQVAHQAAAISKEMRARREAAVEFQATLRERTRLAANLHDTLLQSMAGIGFQLEASQMSLRRSTAWAGDDTAEQLDVARRMVDHAVDDIRGSVWALRSAAVHGRSLTEAINALVTRVGAGHRASIRLQTQGPCFDLPDFVTGNLLLIVQEALFNAIRHGDPESVDVAVVFEPETASVELSVHDDGVGFALGEQRGPDDGHFGLEGMRERAERLGGRLTVESGPGVGTSVRCRVRCRDYDPEMEQDDGLPPNVTAEGHGATTA